MSLAIQHSGLAKAKVADAVGVKPPALSRWLRGSIPEPRYVKALSETLNVDVNWLIAGDNLDEPVIGGTPREKLKAAREAKGYTQAELAKKVGYDLAVYQGIEEGLSRMGEKMILKVAKLLDIPESDLMSGSDEPPSRGLGFASFGVKPPEIRLPPGMRAKYVPLLSRAQCGAKQAYSDQEFTGEGFLAYNVSDPKAFALRMEGDSMMPEIKPGDITVVTPGATVRNGDIVVAKLNEENGGDVMIKIYNANGPNVTLSSYNAAPHPAMTFPREAFEWIYLVDQWTRAPRRN